MNYILSLLIGILIGSFPTAYIILKKYKNIDITKSGSSNVGAMNFYKVSKSKVLAITVFIIDAAKGIASVLIAKYLIENEFSVIMLGLIGAVLGHCFSFWLKFKGGRGLATAAGGAIFVSIPLLVIWIFLWIVSYAFRKNVHFSNFSATLLTAALSFSLADILNKYSNLPASTDLEFSILVVIVLVIILIKHIEPIKAYMYSKTKTSGNSNE